jgi:hypothetical protein
VTEEADASSDEESQSESEEAEPVASIPDWLSEAAPDDAETAPEPAAWLAEASIEEEVSEEVEVVGTFDEPMAEAEANSDDFAWSMGEPVAEADDTMDWSAGDESDELGQSDDEALEFDADPAHSTFGWIDEADEEQLVAEGPDEDFDEFDEDLLADEMGMERTHAAADSPPPADNAPDWLNAMVPGLDLDYEATEDDEPLDTGYDERPARREQPEMTEQMDEQSRDFDWLVEMVDEESRPLTPITDMPDVPRQRRFVFTRQPAWLRIPTESDNSDDDDFELPEWLQ